MLASIFKLVSLTISDIPLSDIQPLALIILLSFSMYFCYPNLFKWQRACSDRRVYCDLEICRGIISGSILPSSTSFYESRAIPNQRIVRSFGVDNSFTSVDGSYCAEFREKARVLLMGVVEEQWPMLMRSAIEIAEEEIHTLGITRTEIQLVPLVQCVVLRFILPIVFPHVDTKVCSTDAVIIAEKINILWMASKETPPRDVSSHKVILESKLGKIFPGSSQTPRDNPLNLILPAYETMWRIVLRCFLEVFDQTSWQENLLAFSVTPTMRSFREPSAPPSAVSVQNIVWESLRLYPPTQRVYRHVPFPPDQKGHIPERSCIVAADVMALHRNHSIWGKEALRFMPSRWSSDGKKRARYEAFMPFGCRPHICPAKDVAPVLIAMVVAALLLKGLTTDRFEFVVGGEKDRLATGGYLSLERGAYASLKLRERRVKLGD
jgi:Cytochrome P450